MSAMGQKRTSRTLVIYVRYRGQSGHRQVPDPELGFECLLSGAKRTFNVRFFGPGRFGAIRCPLAGVKRT